MLATVKGDVHDIGKNLVDIILTNNGYEVVNLGIKISIAEMIEKAVEVKADAIGMSGLLVKSTLIMRENLEELNARGLADIPVLLGGAALTRSYVERDLRDVYEGRLFYGKDAFEGLRVMDRLGEHQARRRRRPRLGPGAQREPGAGPPRLSLERRGPGRADCRPAPPRWPTDNPVFVPPFLGTKVVKGIPLDDIAGYLNETALFRNQWQFRPETTADGSTETDEEFKARIRPILRSQLAEAKAADMLVPQVVYGYFPANGDGDDLVIWTDEDRTTERARFHYPRQQKAPYLCIADFFRPIDVRRGRLRRLPHRHHGPAGQRRHRRAVRREPLPGVPPGPRPRRRDGRGPGRVLAPPHPRGVGLRRPRTVRRSPACSASSTSGGRYSWGYPACPDLEDNDTVGRAARRRTHRHRGQRGDRVPVPARADHLGPHLPPPPGQVLRRPLKPLPWVVGLRPG